MVILEDYYLFKYARNLNPFPLDFCSVLFFDFFASGTHQSKPDTRPKMRTMHINFSQISDLQYSQDLFARSYPVASPS